MTFLEINGYPLHVVQSSKVKVDPQMNVKSSPMHANARERAMLYFYNAGYSGKRVKFSVLVKDSDTVGVMSMRTYLNNLCMHMEPFTVVTEANDVPNGDYIMLDCSIEQEYHNESIWSLDIQQYYYTDRNIDFDSKEEYLNKSTNEHTTNAGILSRCGILKPGSSGDCVKALQQTLKNAGYYLFLNGKPLAITGVYDENTIVAVANFQKDYREDFNLTVNGLCDLNTKSALLFLAG